MRVRRPSVAVVLALGCSAVWVLMGWAPRQGLRAWYYANQEMAGAWERSTDFPGLGATRIDRRLWFADDEFPEHFFNDATRFNFQGTQPDRLQLPFAARWAGLVEFDTGGVVTFMLSANQPATLKVGDSPQVVVEADGALSTARLAVNLPPGFHPIEVTLSKGWGPHVELHLEWDEGGRRRPVDRLWPHAASPLSRWVAHLTDGLRPLVGLASLLVWAWALWGVLQARLIGMRPSDRRLLLGVALAGVAVLVIGGARTAPTWGRSERLEGGHDWLVYETLARDTLLNGPLQNGGRPLGTGQAYFFQPFYPYFLALVHLVSGEGLFGPLLVQYLLVASCCTFVALIAWRIAGAVAGGLALVVFLPVALIYHVPYADLLLSENLHTPLLLLSLLLLVLWLERSTWVRSAGVGLALTLTTVTRFTTLASLPIVAPVLIWRRSGVDFRRATLIGLLVLVGPGLVGVRNWLVTGHLTILPSSGVYDLELSNKPPDRSGGFREWLIRDPENVARTYAGRALRWFGFLDPDARWRVLGGLDPELAALSAAYGVVSALALARGARRRGFQGDGKVHGPASRAILITHALIWSHLTAVTIVGSGLAYGLRFALAAYPCLAIVVGVEAARLLPRVSARLALALGAGLALACAVKAARPPAVSPAPSLPPQNRVALSFGGQIELVGYHLPSGTVRPGALLPFTLLWRALRPTHANYYTFLQAVSLDGRLAGNWSDLPALGWREAIYPYRQAEHPTASWRPGAVVADARTLRIDPRAQPGVYELRVGAYSYQPGMTPLPSLGPGGRPVKYQVLGSIKVLPETPAPAHPVGRSFADGVDLVGYDLSADGRGLTLLWKARVRPPRDYTVFVHALDAQGQMAGQADSQPQQGALPMTAWDPGDVVPDLHFLPVAGASFEVGLYDLDTGKRVSVLDAQGNPAGDSVRLLVNVVNTPS